MDKSKCWGLSEHSIGNKNQEVLGTIRISNGGHLKPIKYSRTR